MLPDAGRQPARNGPGRGFEARRRAVFTFEAELHDLELQWANRRQQRRSRGRLTQLQYLNHSFLQKLVEATTKLFELRRVRIVQVGEGFRREARNFPVGDGRVGREGVADAEAVVPDQADDVAGIGLIQRFALIAEKLVRARQAHFLL